MIERLGHLAEDVGTAFLSLAKGGAHDLLGDPGDLDVHLKRGDAVAGAGDLEVHIAEMVLVAEDIANHREILAFEDQAHGDARDRALQRNAGVHHRERPPHTVAIELEPLDSVMSDSTRIVYGNSSRLGSIGRSARQASLPWPTSRRPGAPKRPTSPTE